VDVHMVAFHLDPADAAGRQQRVENAIRALGSAVQVHPSVWFLATEDKTRTVRDTIISVMGPQDRLVVGRINSYAITLPLQSPKDLVDRAWGVV